MASVVNRAPRLNTSTTKIQTNSLVDKGALYERIYPDELRLDFKKTPTRSSLAFKSTSGAVYRGRETPTRVDIWNGYANPKGSFPFLQPFPQYRSYSETEGVWYTTSAKSADGKYIDKKHYPAIKGPKLCDAPASLKIYGGTVMCSDSAAKYISPEEKAKLDAAIKKESDSFASGVADMLANDPCYKDPKSDACKKQQATQEVVRGIDGLPSARQWGTIALIGLGLYLWSKA